MYTFISSYRHIQYTVPSIQKAVAKYTLAMPCIKQLSMISWHNYCTLCSTSSAHTEITPCSPHWGPCLALFASRAKKLWGSTCKKNSKNLDQTGCIYRLCLRKLKNNDTFFAELFHQSKIEWATAISLIIDANNFFDNLRLLQKCFGTSAQDIMLIKKAGGFYF